MDVGEWLWVGGGGVGGSAWVWVERGGVCEPVCLKFHRPCPFQHIYSKEDTQLDISVSPYWK